VLYEFAMTPDLFDASVANSDGRASIILVELLRGIAENGLSANLHKDRWLRHVTEKRATTLSPALKDKVLACLSVLHDRHRLVRHPKCMAGDPGNDKEWLNLAFDSHDRIPFHAIVLSQSLRRLRPRMRRLGRVLWFFGFSAVGRSTEEDIVADQIGCRLPRRSYSDIASCEIPGAYRPLAELA